MGENRRRYSGEDRISGLPDELLHAILVRLRSAGAAARTSVLSRRWRHVWAHLPELFLGGHLVAYARSPWVPDAVDAALAAYSARASPLERLHITKLLHAYNVNGGRLVLVHASRAAAWLRFASQHVVGEFCLTLSPEKAFEGEGEDEDEEEEEEVLELPAFPRAKTIYLILYDSWLLRPQPAGLFAALTYLSIHFGRMEGSEITDLVCKHCPQLRDLKLSVHLVALFDVSVLSDSLQSLEFCVLNTRRLEVVAPRLEELEVEVSDGTESHISTPKLSGLVWQGEAYDPRIQKFDDVGRRHLRRLEIGQIPGAASLMRQFDEVDELKLRISVPQETAGYESLLNETNQLPKCRTLNISLSWVNHDVAQVMLHLLRSCNRTRKVSVVIHSCSPLLSARYACPLSCPCRLAQSARTGGIALSCLEEIKLSNFKISNDELEFVEQLSRCNLAVLKKLVIDCAYFPATTLTKEICEKVHRMWRPNVNVEFYVYWDGRLVRFN